MNKVIVPLAAIVVAAAVAWYIGDMQRRDSFLPAPTAPETADSVSASQPIAQASYRCDGGKTINAAFYKGEALAVEPGQPPVPTGRVEIALSDGRSFDLAQTISADGGRYANSDESFVFWDKGDTALILENGAEKDYTGCVVAAPEGPQSSLPGTDNYDAQTEQADGRKEYYYQVDPATQIIFKPRFDHESRWAGDVILRRSGEDRILIENTQVDGPGGQDFAVQKTGDDNIFLLRRSDGDLGAYEVADYYLDLAKNKIIFYVIDNQGYDLAIKKDGIPEIKLGLAVEDNCGPNGTRAGKKAKITDLTLNGKNAGILGDPVEVDCTDSDMFGPYYDPEFDIKKGEIDLRFGRFDFALVISEEIDGDLKEVLRKEFYIPLGDPDYLGIISD